jgi:hypothetical protein
MKYGWLAILLTAACGTKTAASATTDVVADVAAADAEDAAADLTVNDDGMDAVAPKLTPAQQMCTDIATQICGAAKTCCTAGVTKDCVGAEYNACLKVGFEGIDDASAAGVVKLDATRGKACQDALNAAAKNCDYVGLRAARHLCLLAWLDTASVGDQCTASSPVACDSFAGRCDPVTTDSYACRKAGGDGDGCNLGKPCGVDLDCLNTKVTRATICGKPASTCELSDACTQGFKCDPSYACAPWDGGGKDGVTCKADNECAVGFKCDINSVKCTPSLCGL